MPLETQGLQGALANPIDARRKEAKQRCVALCQQAGLLPLADMACQPNELWYVASSAASLIRIASRLAADLYNLELMVGNDEQGHRQEGRYCLYYVFSHPQADLFLTIVYILSDGDEEYPSLRPHFACTEPFEREIADLLGLWPRDQREFRGYGARLHAGSYPERLYPLRRDKSLADIRTAVRDHYYATKDAPQEWMANLSSNATQSLPDGEMLVPVGPIHAGVIEPGHFLFHLEGEVVRRVDIQLGYTHRGIERLFQEYDIRDEQIARLAEFVSGDSAFAHSLAYCRAVEKALNVQVPSAAQFIRALLLEVERIANHIGDVGALAHDLGRDVIASDLGMLRERTQELCRTSVGNRLLMGVNVPGGVTLRDMLDLQGLQATIEAIVREFARRCRMLDTWAFRRRTRRVGVLQPTEALRLGVTGMAARACGLLRDVRLIHPEFDNAFAQTIYARMCEEIGETRVQGKRVGMDGVFPDLRNSVGNSILLGGREYAGDVYARFSERLRQVRMSALLVQELIKRWDMQHQLLEYQASLDVGTMMKRYVSLGYAEGWRGDIMYWLMVEPSGEISRCKVRDPSMLIWPAVEAAVRNNYLSDFPLINKSFNLSYSGNDL